MSMMKAHMLQRLMDLDEEASLLFDNAEDEARRSALNARRYEEFLSAYTEYERMYRPCGN